MTTHRHLSTEDQHTLEAIFRPHDSATLEWTEIVRLIEEVGAVHDKGHGLYQFLVNGEHHEFQRPRHDVLTNADERAALRGFLERARMTP